MIDTYSMTESERKTAKRYLVKGRNRKEKRRRQTQR